ncbi:Hypothetical protein I595_304 [Croceitalea dokdonensis DOKDO 023]|uniref:Transmembrane protein n=1 Tax=Croceitalea dokdonensis DOKDO 023 TaxID=1300341 RepID=A0A0P7B267_9FLAO|nr:hypothetical protein [Croceitalea dokdonensis]KPM33401.1 Hypothetical protein I595_304 [Croceitalea dokdonensis DOKDO 023]
MLHDIKQQLAVDKKLIAVYCVLYFGWGLAMNWLGIQLQLAKFTYWWQVFTCYILYMVPISLLLRGLRWHAQYAYGLIAMGLLELAGYALKTSYAYPNNVLDQILQERNFSLAMALFFAFYFPLGNWAVGKIYHKLFS